MNTLSPSMRRCPMRRSWVGEFQASMHASAKMPPEQCTPTPGGQIMPGRAPLDPNRSALATQVRRAEIHSAQHWCRQGDLPVSILQRRDWSPVNRCGEQVVSGMNRRLDRQRGIDAQAGLNACGRTRSTQSGRGRPLVGRGPRPMLEPTRPFPSTPGGLARQRTGSSMSTL